MERLQPELCQEHSKRNLKGAFKELGNSLLSALVESLITPFTKAFTEALGGVDKVTSKLAVGGRCAWIVFGKGTSSIAGPLVAPV